MKALFSMAILTSTLLWPPGGEAAAETGLGEASGGETEGAHATFADEHLPQGAHPELCPSGQ